MGANYLNRYLLTESRLLHEVRSDLISGGTEAETEYSILELTGSPSMALSFRDAMKLVMIVFSSIALLDEYDRSGLACFKKLQISSCTHTHL